MSTSGKNYGKQLLQLIENQSYIVSNLVLIKDISVVDFVTVYFRSMEKFFQVIWTEQWNTWNFLQVTEMEIVTLIIAYASLIGKGFQLIWRKSHHLDVSLLAAINYRN
jgi:RecB family endonuclease NucS